MVVDRKDVPKYILEYYNAKKISIGSRFELYTENKLTKEAQEYSKTLEKICENQRR